MTVQERLAQHLGRTPDTAQANFVADNATVIGDVTLGPKSSVFYGAVLRGDIARIVLGEGSNIQDNAIVHLADDGDAIIGNYCTSGHGAIVHACTIGDECLIGMGSIIALKAFAATIIGGFGDVTGAIVGGLLLGVIESLAAYHISVPYKDAYAFLALFIFLLFRPSGIFGEKVSEKA